MPVNRARIVRIMLITAVVVGVIVDGFFAIVNFYPVAPHADRGPKRYIVMQLDDAQATWFTANVLDDFNVEANANVELIPVAEEEQLLPTAEAARAQGKDVILVAMPATQIGHAVASKLVRPFEGAFAASKIARDFADLGAKLLAPGKLDGAQYFLPRMTVVDVAVFRISKVRDAVVHWSVLRPQIDAALKAINGRGLPEGYELNLSPEDWDTYDVFVMAYFWANRSYSGQPAEPRVAHRTGDELDGQQDIAASIFGFGATDATFDKLDSPAALDYFQWETLFRQQGLYPDAMYRTDHPYDDDAVIAGIQKGDLFLAPIDTMDSFELHGGSFAAATAHVDDPGDLEFTEIPSGASLALGANHRAARTAPSFAFREDWVWGLMAGTHATDVAYDFVRFLWRPQIHARECEALGMLPSHPEVVAERVSRFRLEWMTHVFAAGLTQAQRGEVVPPSLVGKGLGSIYAQLWARLVSGDVPPTPIDGIAAILRAPPAAKPLATAPPTPVAIVPTPAVDRDAGVAEPAAAAVADDEVDNAPEAEEEDWETDVVIQARDAGVARGDQP